MSEFNLQRISEHVRNGRWRKIPAEWNSEGFTRNSLCGDEIRVRANVSEGFITMVRFHAQGCMVSQACASMLCEGVEGKSVEEVLKATPEELMDFEIRELTMNRRVAPVACNRWGPQAMEASPKLSDPMDGNADCAVFNIPAG